MCPKVKCNKKRHKAELKMHSCGKEHKKEHKRYACDDLRVYNGDIGSSENELFRELSHTAYSDSGEQLLSPMKSATKASTGSL